jgi:2-deoxy-D-gluconate 3-dehydrogenase
MRIRRRLSDRGLKPNWSIPSESGYEGLFDLDDRVAVVTGGASGIGKAIALALAAFGASIVIADVDISQARRIGFRLQKVGKKCLAIQTDVTKLGQVDRMVKKTLQVFDRIDILVNSAGVSKPEGPAAQLSGKDWDETIAVNLKGSFLCCQRVGRVMMKEGKGKIINISSVDYKAALPQLAAYCASKGGVISLTKSLAVEWAKHNITVNAIAPSEFDTPMLAKYAKGRQKEAHAKWISRAPLPRARGFIGKPAEVAGAAVFLASDASTMVTGHVLHVDGGLLAG